MAKKVTLQMLKAVAEDFNSFMFAEGEGIDLKLKQPALQKEIVESAGELADDDTITAETAETLALLNLTHEAQVAEAEEEEQEAASTDTDEEETDDEPEACEESADEEEEELDDEVEPEDPKIVKALLAKIKKAKDIDAVKAIAKARGIRIPPPFLKDLAKLKTYVTGKVDGSAPVVSKPEKKKSEGPSVDAYGFRPGCKKSLVMAAIAEKGGANIAELTKLYKGQALLAIKQTFERTKTKVEISEKTGIAKIVK